MGICLDWVVQDSRLEGFGCEIIWAMQLFDSIIFDNKIKVYTMTTLHKNLSKEVRYYHELDAYQQTPTTRKIERETVRKLSPLRSRPTSLSLTQPKKQITYNKWYIHPSNQFKELSQNPKQDRQMLNDEEYVYKNLRNPEFWNWVHPFETGRLPSLKPVNHLDKIEPRILDGFRKFVLDGEGQKRLPSIVEYVMRNNHNKVNPDNE